MKIEKRHSVWMIKDSNKSAARYIAEAAITAAGLDCTNFHVRDRVITHIAPSIDAMLNQAAKAKAKK